MTAVINEKALDLHEVLEELGSAKTMRNAKQKKAVMVPPSYPYWVSLLENNTVHNTHCQTEVSIGIDTSDCGSSYGNNDVEVEFDDVALKSRPHRCTFCVKRFTRKDTLREHERIHTRERPYACQFCSMRFPTQSTCKKHERTHIGDKRYSCTHCGLRFSGKPSLSYHLMVHAGIRPFECQFCNKRFIQNSHLTRHTRVHTGEKPFVCSECGRKFVRNSSLQNHVRKHTGIALVVCQHCSKAFYTKESFDYHLKSHTGIKPFRCSVCGFSFIKGSHLRRHTLRVHKNSGKPCQKGSRQNVKTEPQASSNLQDSIVTDEFATMTENASSADRSKLQRRWSYSCTYCPKQFAHKRGLDSHLRFHVVTGTYTDGDKFSQQDEIETSSHLVNVDDVMADECKLPSQLMCEVRLETDENPPDEEAECCIPAAPRKLRPKKVRPRKRRRRQ